jgi:hypothetical protein
MLYGVEINEPYQVNTENKFRCFVQVGDDGAFSWTSKPERTFATPNKESAEQIASTLAESWDAQVVPVEGGTVREDGLEDIVAAFRARERERRTQFRQIR